MRIFLFFAAVSSLFALSPKTIFVSAEPLPEQIYVGQTVAVTYNAVITEKYYERLETTIGNGDSNGTGVRRISTNPRWYRIDENHRTMKIYYEVTAPRAVFPEIEANLTLLDGTSDSAIAPQIRVGATRLVSNPQFCNVIAEDLEVVSYKVDRYSDSQNILVMEIKAEASNIEKFSLGNYAQEQGIDRTEHKDGETHIFYYAVIAPNVSELIFNYFSPKSGDYKRVHLTFDLSNITRQSEAQIDINPKKRSFPWFSTILLSLFSLILILISIYTRKIAFLGAAVLSIAVIIYIALRDENVMIKAGVGVRLLPTATSTLFYTTEHPTAAAVLKEKSEYVKVLLPDEKIGWVRSEDLE
ncbi:hypothetical protein FACS189487_04340 [Campylobacterota bacterium]|nr:hypothetical protein FACS189487_04340 [Campylobacterota bacterium]